MLHYRFIICNYFEEKQYANKPPPVWWLLAIFVYNFLVNVNVTFAALQIESAVVSKQYEILRSLLQLLEKASSGEQDTTRSLAEPLVLAEENVSKGQFIVSKAGLDELIRGIDVDAADLYRELDDRLQSAEISASAVLYVSGMQGLAVIISGCQAAGRESSPVPPCLPVE